MRCKVCNTDVLQLELVEVTEDAGQDGHKLSIGICQNEGCCQIYYDIQSLEKMLNTAAEENPHPQAGNDIA